MSSMPQAGIAVGVVQDGKIIHQKGYGIIAETDPKLVDEHTLFGIASNSKAFTTTALAILVDQGKVKWTDKVIDYVPEFRMHDPYVTANFTIEDMLTHRSGLGLGIGDLMFFPSGADFTIDDIIKNFRYYKPTSDFRTKFDYDNGLYKVAGELIARITGDSWSAFIENEIMKPLGMNESAGMYQRINRKDNIAAPHHVKNNKIKQIETFTIREGNNGAAGGIYSSVHDLNKWMLMHLSDGKYGSDNSLELVSKKGHDNLWSIHTMMSSDAKGNGGYYNTHYEGYGLGFFIKDQNGYTVVSHTGGLPGMISHITFIPELNVGITILTNCSPGGLSLYTITNEIKDEYIGGDKDWVLWAKERLESGGAYEDSVVTSVWDKVEKSKKVKIDNQTYTGTYKDNWFGEIVIEVKEKNLWFRSKRSPKLNGKMQYYQANTFAIAWEGETRYYDAFASFQLDENGKAISIKMKGISPFIDFSYDFHDLDLQRVSN